MSWIFFRSNLYHEIRGYLATKTVPAKNTKPISVIIEFLNIWHGAVRWFHWSFKKATLSYMKFSNTSILFYKNIWIWFFN